MMTTKTIRVTLDAIRRQFPQPRSAGDLVDWLTLLEATWRDCQVCGDDDGAAETLAAARAVKAELTELVKTT